MPATINARVIGISKKPFYGKFIERGWDWTFPPRQKEGWACKEANQGKPVSSSSPFWITRARFYQQMRAKFSSQIMKL